MESNHPHGASMGTSRKRTSPRDMGRAVLWAPLIVAGIVVTVFAARKSQFRRWVVNLWQRTSRRWDREWGDDSFPGLRNALIGSSRQAIKDVLGPPLAAIVPQNSSSDARSEVWYYPLSHRTQSAMAIQFTGGLAQAVDLIQVPRLS